MADTHFDELDSLDDLNILDDEPVSTKFINKKKSTPTALNAESPLPKVVQDGLDNINPDLDDLVWDEVPSVPGAPGAPSAPSVPSQNKLSENDKKLLERYQDLDVDDEAENKEMDSLRENRRKLSEKLEQDPVFREKYIQDEKKRRESQDDALDIISRLQGKDRESRLEDIEVGESDVEHELQHVPDVPDVPDIPDISKIPKKGKHRKIIKPGVYVKNVQHLTININIS